MEMQNELENIEMLQSLMPGLDKVAARRILHKYNNDMQSAATAVLEGETGEDVNMEPTWPLDQFSRYDPWQTKNPSMALRINNTPEAPDVVMRTVTDPPVIDLTGDEDAELSRALRLSLEEPQPSQQPKFRPSDRSPDPNWAMVAPNSTQGRRRKRVTTRRSQPRYYIKPSGLSAHRTEDKYVELPIEDRIRYDRRPVALRVKDHRLVPCSLVLHALFFVPQIRQRISQWRPHVWNAREEFRINAPSINNPEYYPWNLLELFAYMDLAHLKYICVDELLMCLKAPPHTSGISMPGELSEIFYSAIARGAEPTLSKRNDQRLFHYRLASTRFGNDQLDPSSPIKLNSTDISCVRIEIDGTEVTSDLTSCLTLQLFLTDDDLGGQPANQQQSQSILAPSDVVAFRLVQIANTDTNTDPDSAREILPFSYPKSMYLDPFLRSNKDASMRKREKLLQLQELIKRRESLISFNGRDTRKTFQSVVRYFQGFAIYDLLQLVSNDDLSAARQVEINTRKLTARAREIFAAFERMVNVLDSQIRALKQEVEVVFDDPALQTYNYELRAVLVHDGDFGRQHVYSYVQDAGVWWKTVDHDVIQVSEETVLTDTAGLRINSGPYMLFYSRETDESVDEIAADCRASWPLALKETIQFENLAALAEVDSPAAAERARTEDTWSPPMRPAKYDWRDAPWASET